MDNKYILSSLENTLKIIDIMSEVKEISIKELSERMSLANSTVFRILNTLLKYDYVTQNESTYKYSLAFKFVNIADAILQKYDIITITRDCIEDLVEIVDENVVMVTFANNQITTIEDYSSHKKDRVVYYNTGCAYPAYASSAGNAFLAYFSKKRLNEYLDDIALKPLTPYTVTNREQLLKKLQEGKELGYFECNQEVTEGVISLSAPIFKSDFEVEAVITVYGAASEINQKKDFIVEHLKTAASKCTKINRQCSL